MISFYPGPSRVHDAIPQYVKDAYKGGIMSINHRSPEFVEMSKKTITLLKGKLNIPKNYTVLYTTSATECWEIIAQSLIKEKSYHLYNGSFGEKWFEYTKRLHNKAEAFPFHYEEKIDPRKLIFKGKGVICLTQNETSNGTQVSNSIIRAIKKNNPQQIIAVDATSSMAGVVLDFKAADVWFASVQKCFGLPAGLGLMICSPQAIERAKSINDKKYYNSLLFMLEMMDKWQTPCTPNVLNVYLLMRVMEKVSNIVDVEKETKIRFDRWEKFFNGVSKIKLLVNKETLRSLTVLPLEGDEETILRLKTTAKKNGFLLGEGYGQLKKNTVRIANFPAIQKREIDSLLKLLRNFT